MLEGTAPKGAVSVCGVPLRSPGHARRTMEQQAPGRIVMSLLPLEVNCRSANTGRLAQEGQRMIASAWEFKRLCENESDTSFALRHADDQTWRDILSTYPELARCVAGNKTIPLAIIEQLAASDDVDVRWKIASKRRLDPALMSRLARDSDASVRHRIACNPKVSKEVLELLTGDPDEMVAASAQRRLQQV
ncbi:MULTISPECIES: hypothetical protein [Stenotrophomonas]|nr:MULTISPECIES: hypothetical protein [Stenotrophomonas]MBC9117654.1 hypothetical protein [Stenotrophomonas maltophilia]MBH1605315.1 hypothetical protein [Stenotrophomonas maltophilia]MDQ7289601.1 hypothetical protein [Stenotrophomonas sp. Sm2128]MDT3472192.1 hypothetical protein [Stenotrophomonas maltophilia]HDX0808197.1 hypothetical protein [Stenotrophomonas maltophilia]